MDTLNQDLELQMVTFINPNHIIYFVGWEHIFSFPTTIQYFSSYNLMWDAFKEKQKAKHKIVPDLKA